ARQAAGRPTAFASGLEPGARPAGPEGGGTADPARSGATPATRAPPSALFERSLRARVGRNHSTFPDMTMPCRPPRQPATLAPQMDSLRVLLVEDDGDLVRAVR